MHFSLLKTKEVKVNQVVWFGEVVEEEKSNDWSTESSCQKGQYTLEKFAGESSVSTNPALQQDCWDQPAPGKDSSPVKRVKSEVWTNTALQQDCWV